MATPEGKLCHTSLEDFRALTKRALEEWAEELDRDDEAQNEETRVILQRALESFQTTKVNSTYFDDMCTDFMAPILRGTATPTMGRSHAITRFWTTRFDWGASSNMVGYAPQLGATPRYDPALHPVVLYNATDADLLSLAQ